MLLYSGPSPGRVFNLNRSSRVQMVLSKASGPKLRLWTAEDIAQLKHLAKQGAPRERIAEILGRTLSAIDQKATSETVSLVKRSVLGGLRR